MAPDPTDLPNPRVACIAHQRSLCFECYRAARERERAMADAEDGLYLVEPLGSLTEEQLEHRRRMLAHLEAQVSPWYVR